MLSKANVRRQLEELKREVAAIASPWSMVVVRIPHDKPRPLARFDAASTEAQEKWPQIMIIALCMYGPVEECGRDEEQAAPARRPWDLARASLNAAIRADVVAWLGSPEHKEQLAAQVRDHVDQVWKTPRACRHTWIDTLREDRAACERYGVPFPPEAEAIVREDWTAFAAERGALQVSGHFVELASADATIEMEPTRPELPPPATWLHGRNNRLTVAEEACKICYGTHTASEVRCVDCGCPAVHHPSVSGAWLCRYCSYPPAAHWGESVPTTIYFGRARMAVCGDYHPYVIGSVSDPCACGRCSSVHIEPPTGRKPVAEAR